MTFFSVVCPSQTPVFLVFNQSPGTHEFKRKDARMQRPGDRDGCHMGKTQRWNSHLACPDRLEACSTLIASLLLCVFALTSRRIFIACLPRWSLICVV